MKKITEQITFRPALSTVYGPKEYRIFRDTLVRIDELLDVFGIEAAFVQESLIQRDYELLEQGILPENDDPVQRSNYSTKSRMALRCEIARILTGDSFRAMEVRLSDSELLQYFCRIRELDQVKSPGKSSLERFSKWLPEEKMRPIVNALISQLSSEDNKYAEDLNLANPLDMALCYLDTTCVKANIHHPVDWVLLKDVSRTLVAGILLIREQGLLHRMGEPKLFLKEMNKLSIKMTHARRCKDAKKKRKRILREMKKQLKKAGRHAKNHMELFKQDYSKTVYSKARADQIIARMEKMLSQIPKVIKQAHERIIGDRLVKNEDKILSVYEEDIHVIKRGKASGEIEFGNTFLLAENIQGLIVDWMLYEEKVKNDSHLIPECLNRLEKTLEEDLKALATDRGFDSPGNRNLLTGKNIFNAICPKSPTLLEEKLKDDQFESMQTRRAQTEGRIGIFKNVFLGKQLRSKGFTNRNSSITWAVLAHNLWMLARMPRAGPVEKAA
jgi:hypothetical protein